MALVLRDRVQETTNTTGTGTLTLAGAVSTFQSFSVIGNGNTTYYTITSGTDWEVGIGTYTLTGTTLSRDTVLSSSAAGAKITVAAGATVFCDYPAAKAVFIDTSGVTPINSIAHGFATFTASGTPVQLTAASATYQLITGTVQQTVRLPDATTVPIGTTFYLDSDSIVNTVVTTSTGVFLGTIAAGNVMWAYSASNSTAAGNWGIYFLSPASSAWANSTAYGAAITTAAGWNLP